MQAYLDEPEHPGKQEFVRGRIIRTAPLTWGRSETRSNLEDNLRNILEGTEFRMTGRVGFLLEPGDDGVVLVPDTSVIPKSQVVGLGDYFIPGAPITAVEVPPPDMDPADLMTKVHEYLKHGSDSVWHVDQERRVVHRYALMNGRLERNQFRESESIPERFGSVTLADVFSLPDTTGTPPRSRVHHAPSRCDHDITRRIPDPYLMSNLSPQSTGLPFIVWISVDDGTPGVNVHVSHEPIAPPDITVAIQPDVHLVSGEMNESDFGLLRRWVELNREVLVRYWNGEIDTMDAIAALR